MELALLESAANGNALDAGQAALVRSMCTSGARLQLAIGPAGAGKTTAMRTLARAWSDSGGQVIGLAPSAAAAAQLRDATGALTDTLEKLTWSIHHRDVPDWAEHIGRSTLVIIDEAGPGPEWRRRGGGDRNTKKCLGRVCCRTSRQSLSESRSPPSGLNAPGRDSARSDGARHAGPTGPSEE